MPEFVLFQGSAPEVLAQEFGNDYIDCCVTSPPYYKQRDYKHPGQIGQEKTVQDYIEAILAVTEEIHRVLKPTGSFWLNVDDSYVNKELQMIPTRIALGMRRQGWFLRCDVIWHKQGLVPKAARDRITREHEYVFHAVKNLKGYYFDQDPIREPHSQWAADCIEKAQKSGTQRRKDYDIFNKEKRHAGGHSGISRADFGAAMNPLGRQKRSVWPIVPSRFKGKHYATFPKELAATCIKCSCPPEGLVLDPFAGSGTSGLAALQNGRHFLGIELTEEATRIADENLSAHGHGEIVHNC